MRLEMIGGGAAAAAAAEQRLNTEKMRQQGIADVQINAVQAICAAAKELTGHGLMKVKIISLNTGLGVHQQPGRYDANGITFILDRVIGLNPSSNKFRVELADTEYGGFDIQGHDDSFSFEIDTTANFPQSVDSISQTLNAALEAALVKSEKVGDEHKEGEVEDNSPVHNTADIALEGMVRKFVSEREEELNSAAKIEAAEMKKERFLNTMIVRISKYLNNSEVNDRVKVKRIGVAALQAYRSDLGTLYREFTTVDCIVTNSIPSYDTILFQKDSVQTTMGIMDLILLRLGSALTLIVRPSTAKT